MHFKKRYEFTERDQNGKLISTGEYSTPEDFDRDMAKYPPIPGHTITLFDSYSPADPFCLSHKVVREVVGT